MIQHPAEREAERLRIIITALAAGQPDMELGIAAPIIFETERRTAELERQQVKESSVFMLPDDKPETIAAFIALQPDIADLCVDKKINAIKEVRSRAGANDTHIGLKEAKEGVEHFVAHGTAPAPSPTTWGWCNGNTPLDICEWIEEYGDIVREAHDSGTSGANIRAIKEVRAVCPTEPNLKEAKDGYDRWVAVYR